MTAAYVLWLLLLLNEYCDCASIAKRVCEQEGMGEETVNVHFLRVSNLYSKSTGQSLTRTSIHPRIIIITIIIINKIKYKLKKKKKRERCLSLF